MSTSCSLHVYIAADEEYHLARSSFALDLCSLLSHAQTIPCLYVICLQFALYVRLFVIRLPCCPRRLSPWDHHLSLLFYSRRFACIFGFLLWHCNTRMYDSVKKKKEHCQVSDLRWFCQCCMNLQTDNYWVRESTPPSGSNLPPPPVFTRPQKLVLDFREAKTKRIDRRRDRTCNLLIRSQAPCHWASRPGCYGDSDKMCTISGSDVGLA